MDIKLASFQYPHEGIPEQRNVIVLEKPKPFYFGVEIDRPLVAYKEYMMFMFELENAKRELMRKYNIKGNTFLFKRYTADKVQHYFEDTFTFQPEAT